MNFVTKQRVRKLLIGIRYHVTMVFVVAGIIKSLSMKQKHEKILKTRSVKCWSWSNEIISLFKNKWLLLFYYKKISVSLNLPITRVGRTIRSVFQNFIGIPSTYFFSGVDQERFLLLQNVMSDGSSVDYFSSLVHVSLLICFKNRFTNQGSGVWSNLEPLSPDFPNTYLNYRSSTRKLLSSVFLILLKVKQHRKGFASNPNVVSLRSVVPNVFSSVKFASLIFK